MYVLVDSSISSLDAIDHILPIIVCELLSDNIDQQNCYSATFKQK